MQTGRMRALELELDHPVFRVSDMKRSVPWCRDLHDPDGHRTELRASPEGSD